MVRPFEGYGSWLPGEAAVPDQVFGYVSVRSQGRTSVLEAEDLSHAEPFYATKEDRDDARHVLDGVGLTVTAESRLGFAVVGRKEAYAELSGGQVVTRELLLHAEAGRRRYVTHLDIVGADQPPDLGVGKIVPNGYELEALYLERPRILLGVFPSPLAPSVPKFHLRVPDEVALLLGATAAHRGGHRGDGVTVAMVDTGHYAHPYFLAHDYDVQPVVSLVPGTDAAKDPVGHGTGESANLFAVAPHASLHPYRAANDEGRLVASIAGFLQAKAAEPKPRIITNSWGGDGPYPPGPLSRWERAWALEIRDAVEQGILVVFAAGNSHFSVEPQVPGVLAAGGAYVDQQLEIYASNYASGYLGPWFNRTVPTVCGLVGQLPRAQYLMLPVQPKCLIDVEEAQAERGDPPDGTGQDDGWALFSGTSAAAPQLAGAAALLFGAKGDLTPGEVVEALAVTATDVQAGSCHPRFNHPAVPGRDLATGYGLVNVDRALRHVCRHDGGSGG
jgi:subtilisin family serine protease